MLNIGVFSGSDGLHCKHDGDKRISHRFVTKKSIICSTRKSHFQGRSNLSTTSRAQKGEGNFALNFGNNDNNGGKGGGGGHWNRWGNGGNDDGFNQSQYLFSLSSFNSSKDVVDGDTSDSQAEDTKENKRSGPNICTEIVIENFPEKAAGFSKGDLLSILAAQKGQPFTHQELIDDRHRLENLLAGEVEGLTVSTFFEDESTNRQRVVYSFRGVISDPAFAEATFRIEGATLMPAAERRRLCRQIRPRHARDIAAMNKLRELVEGWYAARGLPMCFISGFDDVSKIPASVLATRGAADDVEAIATDTDAEDDTEADKSGSPSSLQERRKGAEKGKAESATAASTDRSTPSSAPSPSFSTGSSSVAGRVGGPLIRAFVTEPRVERVRVSFLKRVRRQSDRDADAESSDEEFVEGDGSALSAQEVTDMAEHRLGHPYRAMDSQLLVSRLYGTGLVNDVVVEPEQLSDDAEAVGVAVRVVEAPKRQSELDLYWTLPLPQLPSFPRKQESDKAKGRAASRKGEATQGLSALLPRLSQGLAGLPGLKQLVPSGSISYSRTGVLGRRHVALSASLSASDWLRPASDLGVAVSLTDPFFAPQGTSGNVQIFNTRKVASAFFGAEELGEVPPVFLDRAGVKAWTSSSAAPHARVDHALLVQTVTALDENGRRQPRGTKVLQNGMYSSRGGPRTTLSGDGSDLSLSYQGYAEVQDIVYRGGGGREGPRGAPPAMVGSRGTFQVDAGVCPSAAGAFSSGGASLAQRLGLFNKVLASYTQYVDLTRITGKPGIGGGRKRGQPRKAVERPPPTLVLHTKAGAALGELPPYEAFVMGGPFSVRGFSHGELGAAKRFAEAAAELRVPLSKFGLPAGSIGYVFVEGASDLGSSAEVPGNPTEYFRKPGAGWSYGTGVKALGAVRLEYARDCNRGVGNVFLNFGERF